MSIARFHVFTGTGNSLFVARKVATLLEARGFSTQMIEVTAAEISRLRAAKEGLAREGGDLDVFVFPVYAMAVPRIMSRYMKSLGAALPTASVLPRAALPRAALLSVNGRMSDKVRDGHEGQALAQAERILGRQGWEVFYRETFDYPQNIANFFSAQNAERQAGIISLMEGRTHRVAADLAEGKALKRPCHLWAHALGWPFGWLYRIFGRRCFGMLFAADERCDGCGLCASRCPASAITMRGRRPSWSYKCEGCERCINICPKKAIQGSLVRLAVLVAICSTVGLCPLKGLVETAFAFLPAWAVGTLWTLLAIVLGFAFMRLIDLVLVALGLVPIVRPILGFGWTRWTRRYLDPNSARSRFSISRDIEAS
jgi:NAD-dependent dihydropyrimidine dehydrogenase PreA subunit